MTATADQSLDARQWLDRCRQESDPLTLPPRLDAARQVLASALRTADDELIADAWRLHLMTLLEAERVAEIDTTLGELHTWCRQHREPATQKVRDWFRALRAILDGDPELAEALLATSVSPRDALGPLTTIRCFQGRFDELETTYRQVRRDEPAQPSPVVMLAWLWAQQGRLAAARGAVDTLGPIDTLPRDRDYLVRIAQLAELSIYFDDRPMAEYLYRTLRPFARRIVLIGDGFGCWGSTDRPLGLLCRYLGRREEAAGHFADKIALSAAAGAHPWLARGQLDLAELLLEAVGSADGGKTGGPGGSDQLPSARERSAADPSPDDLRRSQFAEARRHASDGIATARRLDYAALHQRADRVEATFRGLDGPPSSAGRQSIDTRATMQILGGFSAMTATGEPVNWTSRKASELMCILLAARGKPVSRERLMEYLWPGQAPHRLRNRLAVAISTARRVLDSSGTLDRSWYICTTTDTVRSCTENLVVDAETFLQDGATVLATFSAKSPAPALLSAAQAALGQYAGEAFADFPYAEWAAPLREECLATYVALLHSVITVSTSSLHRADAARRILAVDPFDESANDALAAALNDLGARGLAAAAIEQFRSGL